MKKYNYSQNTCPFSHPSAKVSVKRIADVMFRTTTRKAIIIIVRYITPNILMLTIIEHISIVLIKKIELKNESVEDTGLTNAAYFISVLKTD